MSVPAARAINFLHPSRVAGFTSSFNSKIPARHRPRDMDEHEDEKDVRLVCLLAFLLPQDALWILSNVAIVVPAKILMKLSSIKTWLFHDRDPEHIPPSRVTLHKLLPIVQPRLRAVRRFEPGQGFRRSRSWRRREGVGKGDGAGIRLWSSCHKAHNWTLVPWDLAQLWK